MVLNLNEMGNIFPHSKETNEGINAKPKNIKRVVIIVPNDFYTSNTISSNLNGVKIQFPNGSTTLARTNWIVPRDISSGSVITFKIYWNTAAAAGDCYWQIFYSHAAKGIAYNAVTENSGTNLRQATEGTDLISIASWTVTGENFKGEDWMGIQLKRIGGDATDTIDLQANFNCLVMEYESID